MKSKNEVKELDFTDLICSALTIGFFYFLYQMPNTIRWVTEVSSWF